MSGSTSRVAETLAADEREALEIDLLVEGIRRRWGYDFREYAQASRRRRIVSRLVAEGVPTVTALLERVLHDHEAMERLLAALTVHTTAMFRDPGFYVAFREQVVPILRTYPFIRIWCAGCSTGEEVHSLAILLAEEGLSERSRIYATDLSPTVLDQARAGVYPLGAMKEWTGNYLSAGGTATFSDYYVAREQSAIFLPALRANVVFAQHNLVTDASFNEFQVILCRNVMIYFNRQLQERVHELLHASLIRLGYLVLGRKESLRFSGHEGAYEVVSEPERIYRRTV